MKISILALLLFLGLASAVFSEDISPENCWERLNKEAKTSSKISILKKDQQTVSGYFRGVESDSLLYTRDKIRYSKKSVLKTSLDNIESVTYETSQSLNKEDDAILVFLLGAFGGGLLGASIANNGDDNADRTVMALGTGAIVGLVAFLFYSNVKGKQIITHQINCD